MMLTYSTSLFIYLQVGVSFIYTIAHMRFLFSFTSPHPMEKEGTNSLRAAPGANLFLPSPWGGAPRQRAGKAGVGRVKI